MPPLADCGRKSAHGGRLSRRARCRHWRRPTMQNKRRVSQESAAAAVDDGGADRRSRRADRWIRQVGSWRRAACRPPVRAIADGGAHARSASRREFWTVAAACRRRRCRLPSPTAVVAVAYRVAALGARASPFEKFGAQVACARANGRCLRLAPFDSDAASSSRATASQRGVRWLLAERRLLAFSH